MTDTVSRRSTLRLLGGAITVVAAATGGLAPLAHAGGRPGHGAGPRVERLLARLTLDEKISLLHGATDPVSLGQAGYVPGVARLGIPPLRLADGPAGVRVTRHATALPAPVLLASAFDPEPARRYGRVIGPRTVSTSTSTSRRAPAATRSWSGSTAVASPPGPVGTSCRTRSHGRPARSS